jgi:hypothetical protein
MSVTFPTANLPSLPYVGDVPVESSYRGSALLYRLLQSYPPGRLRITEGNLRNSSAERPLGGMSYLTVKLGWARTSCKVYLFKRSYGIP